MITPQPARVAIHSVRERAFCQNGDRMMVVAVELRAAGAVDRLSLTSWWRQGW